MISIQVKKKNIRALEGHCGSLANCVLPLSQSSSPPWALRCSWPDFSPRVPPPTSASSTVQSSDLVSEQVASCSRCSFVAFFLTVLYLWDPRVVLPHCHCWIDSTFSSPFHSWLTFALSSLQFFKLKRKGRYFVQYIAIPRNEYLETFPQLILQNGWE